MKLTIPTNWQDDLLKKIKRPDVHAIYGKLDRDFVGGGRASCVLNKIAKNNAKLHIHKIHEEGLKFHYLLNASCMGNKEWTRKGQKKLGRLLDWLSEIKVDGVVVASPYLAQHIKLKYRHFVISVSCFANVNSIEKAKFWEDLGVSVITLSHIEVNRNFRLLGQIRDKVNCKLQLIANDGCIHSCPLFFYHNNISSHASQTTEPLGNFMFDYCYLMCRYKRIVDPTYFICGTWIRPEDIKYYEDIGIEYFKLTDRTMHTDAIVLIVDAYSKRNYKGNLYDLFVSPSKSLWRKKFNLIHKFKYFFHPFTINFFKILKYGNFTRKDIEVYIDNAQLDGFIDYFLTEDCSYKSCTECGYCQRIAEKVVKIDPQYRQIAIGDYENFLNEIVSGEKFKY